MIDAHTQNPPALKFSRNQVIFSFIAIILLLTFFHHFVIDFGNFPDAWNLGLHERVDAIQDWVIIARTSNPVHPIFQYFFNPMSDGIEFIMNGVEDSLTKAPWIVIVLSVFFITQRIANLRITLLATFCVLAMGILGLWEESMETLALMLFSVTVALLIGIPLGILSAKNNTAEQIMRPILDAMQTMPAFVYLIPVLLFFGIGGVPSMIATVIYAIPPAIRLTNLGIRGVSKEALEAARSFGSTPRQILFKVEIPMAMPSIVTGVNQTIMMALGIVVIAALIGFGGLGEVVLKSLRRLRVGQAFEAGMAIVFLAILLDRVSFALSKVEYTSISRYQGNHLFPEKSWLSKFSRASQYRFMLWIIAGILGGSGIILWRNSLPIFMRAILSIPILIVTLHFVASPIEYLMTALYRVGNLFCDGIARVLIIIPNPQWKQFVHRGSYWISVLLILVGAFLVCSRVVEIPLSNDSGEEDPLVITLIEFPEILQFRIRKPIDDAVAWMQVNLYDIGDSGIGTGPFSDFLTTRFVIPLRLLFQQQIPWIAVILIFSGLAFAVADWKIALVSFSALFLIGGLGMWEHAMDTLSQVIVAVALSIIIGIPLGIGAALSDFAEAIVRPMLDFLQTIPAFVYLLPVIMLFNIGRIPGIIASVLYALPPVVRLTNLGIRQVNPATIEAAKAFGSTTWQILHKVQLPLALPTIMLGINQTIMMVLAMVIIAGLVGGGGLGFEVVAGLSQNELGRGVEAGLAIVLMAIVLDRITQSYASKQARRIHINK